MATKQQRVRNETRYGFYKCKGGIKENNYDNKSKT